MFSISVAYSGLMGGPMRGLDPGDWPRFIEGAGLARASASLAPAGFGLRVSPVSVPGGTGRHPVVSGESGLRTKAIWDQRPMPIPREPIPVFAEDDRSVGVLRGITSPAAARGPIAANVRRAPPGRRDPRASSSRRATAVPARMRTIGAGRLPSAPTGIGSMPGVAGSRTALPGSSPMMKAYAIFDGGGALGAALAGCFAAAREQGIEFVGYGGTSAGSIVALLGAVGFDGPAMERFLVDTSFGDFLGAAGAPIEGFKARARSILADLESGRWHRTLAALWRLRGLVRDLAPELGIDDGETLKRVLLREIGGKRPALQGHANVTFHDLLEAGCHPLKIVASDMTRRRPIVFSAEQRGYGDSVLEAVRASTCYPLVFRPYRMNGRFLVDGGLASNLPAFLFHREYQQTGFPVFAFDLTTEDVDSPAILSLKDYLLGLVSTALDAGDELMRAVLSDVVHVPIPIPARFSSLDFRMDRQRRAELFNIGFRESARALSRLEFLKIIRTAGGELQRLLQLRYGSPWLYRPVLAGLAREVEAASKARRVRAYIMLPTGRGTRIVAYSHGMEVERGDGTLSFTPDHDLEIDEGAGCSGRAWTDRVPTAADLAAAAANPAAWGMTREQHDKVPKDRRSMLSVPIRSDVDAGIDDEHLPVVGTLCIDSTTPLPETGWLEDEEVESSLLMRLMLWENVVWRLLRKRHP
jgi:NTE family protein